MADGGVVFDGRLGFCVRSCCVGGNPPFLSALLSSSLLLCLHVNLRLSAALYAKIENTNAITNVATCNLTHVKQRLCQSY